jgi:hypothetical protein
MPADVEIAASEDLLAMTNFLKGEVALWRMFLKAVLLFGNGRSEIPAFAGNDSFLKGIFILEG